MSKRIVVDFDGTITCGYVPNGMATPRDGVQEALQKLKDMGYYISIYSCRTSVELFQHIIDRKDQKDQIEDYLKIFNIPYDEVLFMDKPIADFYIDDRNIEFSGDWSATINKIKDITNEENIL